MQSPQYLKKKQNNNNKRPNEKQICDMNKEKPEIKCYQLNFKKSLLASVEFNKSILKEKRTLCLATEPYISFNRVGNLGKGLRAFPPGASKPRAAIIYDQTSGFVGIEKLSSRDCAVGFLRIDNQLTVVASIYCDITKPMIQDWMNDLINYADKGKYPLLICLDSNAHSTLYGNENNKRGDEFEDFILGHNLEVSNTPGSVTFETVRGDIRAKSCIDVTLTKGLENLLKNWRVLKTFNASDHNTITFDLQQDNW